MNLVPQRSTAPSWRRDTKRPTLAHRVFHIDLKGPKIPFAVFKQALRLYARWGVNGVLVEYEHRLPELPLPRQFPKADRYTHAQVEELTRLARDLGINFIPLVQTLGHVEYLRRVPGTVRMMENPAYPNQLCPSNPVARKYVLDLIDSVCAMHPDSTHVNVGLDETHQLGHCPACKKRAAKLGGKLELYLDHATWVTEEVLRRGRIPMLAGDMFLGHGRADLLARLDPRVLVTPWDYLCLTERVPYVNYKGTRFGKGAFRRDYSGATFRSPLPALPAPGRFADDLSSRELKELGGLDAKTGTAPAFAQARLIAAHNRPLWGLSAADASASGPFMPNFIRAVDNSNQVIRGVINLDGEGAVATCWARGHSFAPVNAMWPLSLYAFAHFAASAWTGDTSPDATRRRAADVAAEIGMPARIGDWTLDDVLWMLSNPTAGVPGSRSVTLRNLLDLLRGAKIKGAFAEGLLLAIEVEMRWQELQFLAVEARWWRPNREVVPPMIGREMRARVKRIEKDVDRLKPVARRYYTTWVGERAAFETWWHGLFDVDRDLAPRAAAMV